MSILGGDVGSWQVFTIVEQMPEFPGGENALTLRLKKVTYPDSAKANGIEGTVYVRFIIDETGNVTNVEVARGAHKLLNDAALELIRSMPKWSPGKQSGVSVKVQYIVPIKFTLN